MNNWFETEELGWINLKYVTNIFKNKEGFYIKTFNDEEFYNITKKDYEKIVKHLEFNRYKVWGEEKEKNKNDIF